MKIKTGLKASIGFLISSIAVKGISYIATPFYTRLMTTDEYGMVSVFMTNKMLIGYIAMFCLSYVVFNNGMLDFEKDRNNYTYSLLILSNVFTAITITGLFTYNFIVPEPFMPNHLVGLLFILYLFEPAHNFWLSRQRYEYKYKTASILSVGGAFLAAVIAIVSLHIFDDKVNARIYGFEAPFILINIGLYVYICKNKKGSCNFDYWKYAVSFNWPLIPYYMSTYILSSSDKLIINKICGPTDTAFYSLAYSFVALGLIAWTAINSSLVPYVYQNLRDGNLNNVRKIDNIVLSSMLVVSIFIIFIAPEAISVLGSSKYSAAIWVVPPVVAGFMFQTMCGIITNIVDYLKKTKIAMYSCILAAVLNVGLNFLLIPLFGYIAAAYTTVACYMIQTLIMCWVVKEQYGTSILSLRYFLLLSITILILSIVISFTYNTIVVRYIFFTIIVAILIYVVQKHKSHIIGFIK